MTYAEALQAIVDLYVSAGYINSSASLSDILGDIDFSTMYSSQEALDNGLSIGVYIIRHKSGRWCPVIFWNYGSDTFDGKSITFADDPYDYGITWSISADYEGIVTPWKALKRNPIRFYDDNTPPYDAGLLDDSFAPGEKYVNQSYYSNHPLIYPVVDYPDIWTDYTVSNWNIVSSSTHTGDGHLFTEIQQSNSGYINYNLLSSPDSALGIIGPTILNTVYHSTVFPVAADFSQIQLGVIKSTNPYVPPTPPGPDPPGPTPGGGMELKLWKNFKKRRNSTKTPTGGTTYTVILKKDTSILAPHFVMSDPEINYNYCKFNDRYYYIEDTISLANGLVELVCEVDPLASGKSDIVGSTQYVERSASVYDNMIDDTLTVIKQESTKNTTRVPMMLDQTHFMFSQGGYYVLSVVNGKGSGSGFNCYYIIDGVTLQKIANYVNQKWGAGASDLNDFFQANFLKTADSIGTCIWLPLSLMTLEDELVDGVDISYEQLQIGTDNMEYGGQPINGYRILKSSCLLKGTWYFDIPHVYTDFRKAKPYTVCEVYIPFVGTVDINPLDFDNDRIYIDYTVDVCTGDAFVTLCSGGNYAAGDCIVYKNGNIAVNMPTGKSGTDVGGVSSGLFTMGAGIAAIASVMAAPPVAAGLTAAQTATLAGGSVAGLTGLSKAVSAGTKSQSSLSGDGGGRAATQNGLSLNCTVIAYDTSDPTDANFIALNGRPLQKAMSLSSLTGYVKCGNVNVPTALTESEKERIDGSLNAGLYIE